MALKKVLYTVLSGFFIALAAIAMGDTIRSDVAIIPTAAILALCWFVYSYRKGLIS